MKTDLKGYVERIRAGKFDEAREYKNSFVPSTLYKFYALFDNGYKNYNVRNKERFTALKQNQVWLSVFDKFNDPFEAKVLILNEAKLAANGWNPKQIETARFIMYMISKVFCITSLSANFNACMPMWAHYANNHHGFCVEYKITNPNLIFEVSYEGERQLCATLIANMMALAPDLSTHATTDYSPEFMEYVALLSFSHCVKHSSWKYENEYRVFSPEMLPKGSGVLRPCSELGLQPIRIFAGLACEPKNLITLKQIGARIGCPVAQMIQSDMTDYCLGFKTL
ncbi:MAG: DUF2971 domain-containing protein [Firmicutes bacterium]|nr:DUF2971 domain-containing protein [Bacillota bacterium]